VSTIGGSDVVDTLWGLSIVGVLSEDGRRGAVVCGLNIEYADGVPEATTDLLIVGGMS